jgi:hypothetical protein
MKLLKIMLGKLQVTGNKNNIMEMLIDLFWIEISLYLKLYFI